MTTPPIKFIWDGESLSPAGRFWERMANEHFTVGEVVRMTEENEYSDRSRAHEFAWLKTAWDSLPDDLLAHYPSPEHLRKRALIAKGHCTMTQHACKSVAEAERLEAAIGAHVDTYAVVVRRGSVVTVYTAVSQSRRAMGAPQFQASKNDIIDYVAGLLQVDPDTLGKQQAAA